MKKTFSIFALLLVSAAISFSQVSFTVVKKGNVNIDSVSYYLNPELIQNVHGSEIRYQDYFNPKIIVNYKVTETLDQIYASANATTPVLIKLFAVSKVAGTTRDTAIAQLYPIKALNQITSFTDSTLPKAKSLAYISQCDAFKKVLIRETPAEIKTKRDSLIAISTDISTVAYDTSNYTQKSLDKHIILKSTTADTLTLLNPNLFAGKSAIIVANIGSGAYTIAGGFTVKDKSGSNVTSIPANTVYTLKSYYDGSSYIWLKEY